MSDIDQSKKQNKGKPPVYQGFLQYFPRAIKAASLVSDYGRKKYDVPWDAQGWRDIPEGELKDAQCRHILDQVIDGPFNPADGYMMHQAQVLWEAAAALEVYIQRQERQGVDVLALMGKLAEASQER